MVDALPYHQDIAHCLSDGDGGRRVSAALDAALARVEPGLTELRHQHGDGSLPLLALPARRDDLADLPEIAAAWRARFARVVLCGTGGSSLGAQALAALVPQPQPALCVPDNLDSDEMQSLLAPATLADTGFLVISKSGGTAETMCQALTAVAAVQAALGPAAAAEHFLMVAEPGDSPLRRLAAAIGAPVLDHDPGIGGRYSVLSLVGLLPVLIIGLDADAVREGAAAALRATLDAAAAADAPPALGAALNVALAESGGVTQSVLLAYAQRLGPFTRWYRQLWAESLGKQGLGTTPIDAIGPVDQHSQLQLWLDGPDDKLFSVLTTAVAGRGPVVAPALAAEVGLDYLAGHSTGDLVAAMQQATIDTLAARGRPVRQFRLQQPDEHSLGALFMHFMLETILAAGLMGVDPFGQPAVEEGKVLARRYLKEGAA